MIANDEIAAIPIPIEGTSAVWHILRHLKLGTSLKQVTTPPFLLESKSRIEKYADWFVNAPMLRAAASESDPILRCAGVCAWFTAGFKNLPILPKQPYASLLFECFEADIKTDPSTSIGHYTAEQVSYSPSVSAFHYSDPSARIDVLGNIQVDSKYLGDSIVTHLDNHHTKIFVTFQSLDETYELTLPSLVASGIHSSSMLLELDGDTLINCPATGVTASISFQPESPLGSSQSYLSGQIRTSSPLLTFDGSWRKSLKAVDHRSNSTFNFHTRFQAATGYLSARPLTDQTEYESQRIWEAASRHLNNGDCIGANEHILALKAKQEAEFEWYLKEGIPLSPQLFTFDPQQSLYLPSSSSLRLPIPISKAEFAGISQPLSSIHSNTERLLAPID